MGPLLAKGIFNQKQTFALETMAYADLAYHNIGQGINEDCGTWFAGHGFLVDGIGMERG